MKKSNRIPFWDNAKWLLILTVVIGHFIEPLISESKIFKIIYITLYAFHMPCFVLLSGYLAHYSKRASITPLLTQYLLFQILYWGFRHLILKETVHLNFTLPYWLLWYLFALIVWRLITPHLVKFKYALHFSIILSILVGYIDSIHYEWSLSRIIVFFPFYLMGYLYFHRLTEWIQRSHNRLISVGIFSLSFMLAFYLHSDINVGWFYHSLPYKHFLTLDLVWIGAIIRFMILLWGCLLTYAFLSLVPKRKMFLTTLGSNTLTVYLWHGFIVKFLVTYPFYSMIDTTVEKIGLIFLSVIITFALSSLPLLIKKNTH